MKQNSKYAFILLLFLFIFSCTGTSISDKPDYILTSNLTYKGAEVYSNKSVLFGKFEVRMKMVNIGGAVSSFFLYDNKSWQGLPYKWKEIDIEALGREKDLLQTNIITGDNSNRIMSEQDHKIKNVGKEFYTYTIEWTPDYVAWYIEDILLRIDTAEENTQIIDLREIPQIYRMNLWISNSVSWAGEINPDTLPVYQLIDSIKYYQYTPGEGYMGEDFTLEWIEDFNSFDSSKWGKGNWSFEGNLAAFSPQNAVIKDGYLILCLTTSDKLGFRGKDIME